MDMNLQNYWVIGDVHGCIHTLEKLIKKLPKDSVPVFVGDLVDRGLFSKDVLEFVMLNNYTVVFGNHEYLMYNYARDAIIRDIQSIWSVSKKSYGGLRTVQSYGNDIDTLLKHIDYITALPKYLEIGKYFITHGFGLPYYKSKDDKSKWMSIYTNRLENPFPDWENGWKEYEIVNIFGHTPYKEVLFGKNYIGVDTGAVFGKKLSAVNLGIRKVIEQKTVKKDIEY